MKILLLACLLIGLWGCGESPLLNHKTLSDRPGRTLDLVTSSFSNLNLAFELQWSVGCPNLTDGCSFDLIFNQAVPTGAILASELWMPSMGHGSSPVEITQVGSSHWNVSEAYFIMPGLWQLKLKLTLPDGSSDEVIFNHTLKP